MPLATYKDFCIDATDPPRIATFWAGVLGLASTVDDDGEAHLTGPTARHQIWINAVPEPKSVKHRVHLDVHARDLDDIVALGAAVVDADSFPWTVMADPEGGEFCVFLRERPPDYRLYEIAFDASDHPMLSAWWHELLGGTRSEDPDGFSSIGDIPGVPFDNITFAPVPEAKTTKNRIHIDVSADDVDVIIDGGARLVRARDDEIEWHVLADPEGNEFCVFVGD